MWFIKHKMKQYYCVIKKDKHIQLLLRVSRMECFLFRPRKRYFVGGESRSTRNYIWRLRWTRWKSCYPFYALFLVSTFIFLTIQFPSRRRSRKLFCLRRLGAESIFHVISAIVGNFDFQYAVIYKTKSISYFKYNIYLFLLVFFDCSLRRQRPNTN